MGWAGRAVNIYFLTASQNKLIDSVYKETIKYSPFSDSGFHKVKDYYGEPESQLHLLWFISEVLSVRLEETMKQRHVELWGRSSQVS